MDKDFENWPGSFPPDAAETQAQQVAAPVEPSRDASNAPPNDGYVKHTAKQFDSSANLKQHVKSNGVIGSVVNMLTGSGTLNKESSKSMEEHYQNLKRENELLQKDNQQYREKLQAQKRETKDAVQAMAEKASKILARNKSDHEVQMIRQQNTHNWELNRIKQEFAARTEAVTKEKKAAEDSCKKLEHEFEIMEKKIRNLQSVQLQSVEAVQWAPHSHSDTEHKLKSIFARVRQWATEYSFLGFDEVLDPEFFASVATHLKKRGCIGDANLLYDALSSNKSIKKPGKAFAMVLAAVVSFDIMQKTIADPFCAFVGGAEDKYILGDRHGRCFRAFVQLVKTYDVAGAEGLRCQLLRLLDPVASGAESVNKIKDIAKESRECAAEQITNEIFEKYSGTLVTEKSSDARAALKALSQEAVDLSWELWTRKARIEVLGWADIQKRTGSILKYSANTDPFEAHPLHNRELDDEPRALDGAEVVLLCSPAIAVAGSAEGQDYDKEKLVKKAIVMLR